MNRTNRALSLAVVAALAGCGGGESESPADSTAEPVLTAATLGPQTVLSVGEYEALPRYVEANIEYGERLSLQCRSCHSLEKDGPHMIGPNLHGFFGRPAGSAEGFPYSRAMRAVDFVWTPRALDAWLAAPTEFLPGTSMVYAGLSRQEDRDALIASLLDLTSVDGEP